MRMVLFSRQLQTFSIDYIGSIIYHTSLAINTPTFGEILSVPQSVRMDCMRSPLVGGDGAVSEGRSYVSLGKDTQVELCCAETKGLPCLLVTDITQ